MRYDIAMLKKMSILFLEDDEIILKQLSDTFRIFFEHVYSCKTIKKSLDIYNTYKPDFILCDIQLNGENGLDFIRDIREVDYQTPIIIISSFSNQKYLFESANLSIDGYLIKPLELDNFFEVIFKSMKRLFHTQPNIKLRENVLYNIDTKELYKDEKKIELGKKERELLELFIVNENKTISKEEISFSIWPLDSISDSAIKNLIGRLRKKIDEELIVTIKGSGWKLNTI